MIDNPYQITYYPIVFQTETKVLQFQLQQMVLHLYVHIIILYVITKYCQNYRNNEDRLHFIIMGFDALYGLSMTMT